MGDRKTIWCFLLVLIGTVIVAQANLSEDEWNAEVFEEETVTDDSVGRRCPKKEHYDKCKGSCDKTCYDYNVNPGVCPLDCRPGCICNRGYVRGPDGTCIKPKKCPSTKCPSGEHHVNCKLNCQKDCSNWNSTHITCPPDCTPGCVCDEGTVRASLPNGKCIKPEECKDPEEKEPQSFPVIPEGLPIPFLCSKKKHEEYSICPSLCADNCTNYQDNRRACKIACLPLPGCVCKSGYVKGPDGECIKPDQCPTDKHPEDCTELEQYTTCGTSCEDNCDNYREKDRDCEIRCNVGCFCLPGYVRGPKGDCIFPFDCPSSQRKETTEEEIHNSEYEIPEEKESTRDPKYDKIPEDIDNSEVEFEEEEMDESRIFPQSLFCKKNQVYSLCPSLCPDDCTNYQEKNRACKIICLPLPACVCKSGYVIGPDGTCIKPQKCYDEQTPEDCLDNEYYSTCASSCEPDCKNYNKDFNLRLSSCDRKCNIGCFCRPGMVKGPNGKCIWPFECEVKASNSEDLESIPSDSASNFCPPHEDFEPCHAYAENDCSTRNRTFPPDYPPLCQAGCTCLPGYVRGSKGLCIKPEECPNNDETQYPVRRICPENEEWSTYALCQPNCSETWKQQCSVIASRGCVCKQGFLRNSEGKCVPESECPANHQGVGIRDDLQTYGCPSPYSCRQHCVRLGGRGGFCVGPGLRFCICYKSTKIDSVQSIAITEH